MSANITLNCLIHGEALPSRRVFSVTISKAVSIDKLRQRVKATAEIPFLSRDLVLWKVDIPLDTSNAKLTALEANTYSDIAGTLGGDELHTLSSVGESFPAVPKRKHIHVIIECTGKSPRQTIMNILYEPSIPRAWRNDADKGAVPQAPRDIWYQVDLPNRQATKLRNFNGKDVDDLRLAIKTACFGDITCNLYLLVVHIARPDSEADDVLDGTLIQNHGTFDTLMQHYQISEFNPLRVELPASTIAADTLANTPGFNPRNIVIHCLENQQVKNLLDDLKMPDTTKFVSGNRLIKNNVVPLGPSGQADMRYFQKKLRGKRAQYYFERLEETKCLPSDPCPRVAALLGVSGCGKTATIFELGRDDFITYFVIPRNTTIVDLLDFAYSLDVISMLESVDQLVSEFRGIVRHIIPADNAKATIHLGQLDNHVLRTIRKLLVARRISWALLHHRFGMKLTPLAWLYCQERADFGALFEMIYEVMGKIDDNYLLVCETSAAVYFSTATQQRQQRFIVAIDECHRLTRFHPGVFLPRSADLLTSDGELNENGQQFIAPKIPNPFFVGSHQDPTPRRPYRSLFPMVVEGFLAGRVGTLILLGTNLELSNLTELDSCVAKILEKRKVMQITEFHSFTQDDVVYMLGECLNKQGLSLTNTREIADEMEGRARFTMGFVEHVAQNKNEDPRSNKYNDLTILKESYKKEIVESMSNVGLQRIIGSLVNVPSNPLTTPMRPNNFIERGEFVYLPKVMQDMLVASMFSRGQILFSSSVTMELVRVGLCHLTSSKTPWDDDVCEDGMTIYNEEPTVVHGMEQLAVNEPEDDDDCPEGNRGMVFERRGTIFESYKSKKLRSTLAEPWMRLAMLFFFKEHSTTEAIYMSYLTSLISAPLLTAAARGSLLDWTIMTNIQTSWADINFQSILGRSGLFDECKKWPKWMTDLKILPFEKIEDESTVIAKNDSVAAFLSGKRQNIALLPTVFSGPDGICATSEEGVFLVFASALSTKNKVSHFKYKKNMKTTDDEKFYTKSNGDHYEMPKKENSLTLRGRHEKIQNLVRKGTIKGLLRIHIHIPQAAGVVPLFEIVKKRNRTDVVLNLDLDSAPKLGLLVGSIREVLCELCINKTD